MPARSARCASPRTRRYNSSTECCRMLRRRPIDVRQSRGSRKKLYSNDGRWERSLRSSIAITRFPSPLTTRRCAACPSAALSMSPMSNLLLHFCNPCRVCGSRSCRTPSKSRRPGVNPAPSSIAHRLRCRSRGASRLSLRRDTSANFANSRSRLGYPSAGERILKRPCYVGRLAFLRLIKLEPGGSDASIHHETCADENRRVCLCHRHVRLEFGRGGACRCRHIRQRDQNGYADQARHHHRRRKSQLRSPVRDLRAEEQGRKGAQSIVRAHHQCRWYAGPEIRQSAPVPDHIRTEWRKILQQCGSQGQDAV